MNFKRLFFFGVLSLFQFQVSRGQSCSVAGQTPGTAFPVCGLDTFTQTTVPVCDNHSIPVAGCANDNASYGDKNPFWYKFTCYQSGTLGFLINPKDPGDDYDWQLFDITGHSPADVYNNASLFVAGNWSGSYGQTGASTAGNANIECASDPVTQHVNTFSTMPILIKGHNYLLLISHYTDSQSGYSLSFGYGGTASITDPAIPGLKGALPSCDRTQVRVLLSKKMKCSSLVPDGSDFTLTPASVAIVSASATSCASGFDMDSLTLTLDNPLPYGNYMLTAKNGTDGNTILDNCDREIAVGASVPFSIVPLQPTPFDSITPPACSPQSLQLVFRKPIHCNSISPDGSDFIIAGSAPVTVTGAAGANCINGLSSTVLVNLSAPILNKGAFQIKLVTGIDGNTIVDECGLETPAQAVLDFVTADTVSAAFSDVIEWGCKTDMVLFFQAGGNGINEWTWIFDDTVTSNLQNPVEKYSVFGTKKIRLLVSNGVCSDTASATVLLDNTLQSVFEAPNLLCPRDIAEFRNASIGHIVNWDWDFGDGSTSSLENPPGQLYPATGVEKDYTVRLIVRDDLACGDTSFHTVKTLRSCYIAVPSAFTPNGDGFNDYLYPLNAYKAANLIFRVFNRFGQLVFETRDWTRKWDGTLNGAKEPSGTYAWTLQYTDSETGRAFFQKGTSILIR